MLPIHARTMIAAATMAGKLGYAVQNVGGTVQLWDTKTEVPAGVIYGIDPFVPTKIDVAQEGSRIWAVAGATLTPGTHHFLTTDSTGAGTYGKLIPAAAGQFYVARLVSDVAVADGDFVEVIVTIGQLDLDVS